VKPRITFRGIRPDLASTRLRAEIPQRELAELGIERGRDILVIGKHGWSWDEATAGYRKVVMDVCDDHFGGVHDAHYRLACSQADAVTCNSAAMRDRIKAETGRDAWVIPDPWEAPEGKPRVHERLVWFGHKTNLRDLVPWLDRLAGRPLAIVSNVDAGPPGVRVVQWSPDAMDREFIDAGLCVIPTGKSACKSGNRAVESIRRGVFPICGYLPAYGDLGVYVGDIAEGVEWALSHHDEVMHRICAAQHYVGWQYNPKRIAKLWLEALSYV
jgi:hypothetical protein